MAKKAQAPPVDTGQPNMEAPWFKRGRAGFEERERLDALADMQRAKAAPRFWLRPGEETDIICVDTEAYWIWEHRFWIAKREKYIPCTRERRVCLMCDGTDVKEPNRPYWTAYLTIIDPRTITIKNKPVKNRRVLYPMVGKTSQAYFSRLLKENNENITGMVIHISRLSSQDAKCGGQFERKGKIDVAKKFGAEAAKPFDYATILAIPTEEEVAAFGYRRVVPGSKGDLEFSSVELDQKL